MIDNIISCGDGMLKQILHEIEEELLVLEEDLKRTVNTRIKLIKKPIERMIDSGGKRLRPAMLLAAARFGEYDFEKIKPLAISIELIHTATLIHDDIIDDSVLRRGISSIQSALGKDVAVFTGDFIFCKVFGLLASSEYHYMLESVAKVMYQICEGELKQREELFNTDIKFRNYLYRIRRKTAILFALSAQMGAIAAKTSKNTHKALYNYGINVGMAFQLIDDVLDIKGDEKKLGKPAGNDIRKGVITLPAIYALTHCDERRVLKQLLQNRFLNDNEVDTALSIVKKSGGVEYTESLAKRYIQRAQSSIGKLPDIPIKKLLTNLSTFIYRRYE